MTETLEDKLKRTADEAWEGEAEKQKLLVNRTFRLDSVELHGFTDTRGNDAEAYIATIVVDGDEVERTFWLGGRLVMPQVARMVEDGDLPVFLTLIEDPELKGQPYRLMVAGEPLPENETPPPTPATDAQSGHPHLDTLVKFCQDNKLVLTNGQVDAKRVLDLLGVTLSETKPPAESFKVYCADIKKRKKLDAEDDIYKVVLEELILAMATKREKAEPESEPIPFG